MAHPGGRPTKYSPKVLTELDKYLHETVPENMDIPSVEGFAIRLGVNKTTLYEWGKKHTEFSNALDKIALHQKAHLMRIGIFGGKEVNASIVSLMLKANHDMVETERKQLVGADNQTLAVEIIEDTKLKDRNAKEE